MWKMYQLCFGWSSLAHISMKVREKTLAKAVTNGDKRTPGTHGSRFRRKPKQKTAYKIMSLYYVVKG